MVLILWVILYWFLWVNLILVNNFISFDLVKFINKFKLMLFFLNNMINLFKCKFCKNVLIVSVFKYIVIFEKKKYYD